MKLNIGLNNNPYTYEDVVNITFDKLASKGSPLTARLHIGTYLGQPEPTAVIQIDSNADRTAIEELCQTFTQECIAVMQGINGDLVYNPNFKGQQYTFDSNYFIR